MLEKKSEETVTATWEEQRSTAELQSFIGNLATRAGLSEFADEIDQELEPAA